MGSGMSCCNGDSPKKTVVFTSSGKPRQYPNRASNQGQEPAPDPPPVPPSTHQYVIYSQGVPQIEIIGGEQAVFGPNQNVSSRS